MDFDSFIAATTRFEERLSKPEEFYQMNAGHHLSVAKDIARQTMIALRPPDTDEERWRRRVEEVVDAVTIDLLSSRDGSRLSIVERPSGTLPGKDDRTSIEAITFDDVMDWIQSGLDGEPGGKNITPEDEANLQSEAGKRTRASIIMKAYYGLDPKPEWQALREHIQRWMRGADGAAPDKLHKAIAEAWQRTMRVVLMDDLRVWLRAQRIGA